MLVAHWLGGRTRVDRLTRFVILAIVSREIVLRIEMGAANDAVVLVGVCHLASRSIGRPA